MPNSAHRGGDGRDGDGRDGDGRDGDGRDGDGRDGDGRDGDGRDGDGRDGDGRADRHGHGEAALLLLESLIHGMLERGDLTLAQAIDIVQTALDVQIELDDVRGDRSNSLGARLLTGILDSLGADRPETPTSLM